jgi:hypothetical protein
MSEIDVDFDLTATKLVNYDDESIVLTNTDELMADDSSSPMYTVVSLNMKTLTIAGDEPTDGFSLSTGEQTITSYTTNGDGNHELTLTEYQTLDSFDFALTIYDANMNEQKATLTGFSDSIVTDLSDYDYTVTANIDSSWVGGATYSFNQRGAQIEFLNGNMILEVCGIECPIDEAQTDDEMVSCTTPAVSTLTSSALGVMNYDLANALSLTGNSNNVYKLRDGDTVNHYNYADESECFATYTASEETKISWFG